jgi:hypothetical protein
MADQKKPDRKEMEAVGPGPRAVPVAAPLTGLPGRKQPPAPAAPARPSSPALPAVPPRTSTGGVQAQRSVSGFQPAAPARPTSSILPVQAGPAVPRQAAPVTRETLRSALPGALLQAKTVQERQDKLLSSDFNLDDEVTAYDRLLGRARSVSRPAAAIPKFDGVKAAPGVEERQVLAIPLAFQNGVEHRSPEAYLAAIEQFAVGTNVRYQPDGAALRANVFVWDVSRALGVEIPIFVNGRQQPLGHTAQWLRERSAARGWLRVSLPKGIEHALAGGPTVVIPRDMRQPMMGFMRPELDVDGKPFVAAAGKRRGSRLTLLEGIGVAAVECYVHH